MRFNSGLKGLSRKLVPYNLNNLNKNANQMYFVLKSLKFYLHYSALHVSDTIVSIIRSFSAAHAVSGPVWCLVRCVLQSCYVVTFLRILKQSTSSWRFYSSYYNDVRNQEPEIQCRMFQCTVTILLHVFLQCIHVNVF